MPPIPPQGDDPPPLPSFKELIASYRDDDEDLSLPEPVSLAAILAGADDPMSIIAYLAGLGIAVTSLDDLLTINDDQTEEDLHAFRCREGIALSIASDGLWILYVP